MPPKQNSGTYWEELNFLCRNEEWEKALKLANKVCQESNDEEVLQCRVICNIRLTKYEEALTILNKQKQPPNNLLFEKAYCEYRLDKLNDALQTIKQSNEERANELLAQILYKLEDYSQCISIYEKLMNNDDEYKDEHETNLWAAKASLNLFQNNDKGPSEIKSLTYEKIFNKACVLVGQKDYHEAMIELKKAHDMCMKVYEEDPDLNAEDLENELAIICIQQAYVYQKLKRDTEALEIYNSIAKQKSSDIVLMAVTNNNIVTLNKDQNLFDSKKRMKLATGGVANQKLISIQKHAIALNDILLLFHSGLMEACQQKINEMKKLGGLEYKGVLINVAMLLKEKNQTKAIQLLEAELAKTNGSDDTEELSLALSQLLLNADKQLEAQQCLINNIKKYKNYLGIVSLLVSIYLSQNDKSAATQLLEEAANETHINDTQKSTLERVCASLHLENGDAAKACQILDKLAKSDSKNPKLIAQLILAYSTFDTDKALAIGAKYSDVDRRKFSNEDLNIWESTNNWSVAKYIKKTGKSASTLPTSKNLTTQLPIKKKKEKSTDCDSALIPRLCVHG